MVGSSTQVTHQSTCQNTKAQVVVHKDKLQTSRDNESGHMGVQSKEETFPSPGAGNFNLSMGLNSTNEISHGHNKIEKQNVN